MKIQLANRTYHRDIRCCVSCHLATIYSKDSILNRIVCPDFILQPCSAGFTKKLFNDEIFKL